MKPVRIVPAGDAALVAEFEERIDAAVNAGAIGFAEALRRCAVHGVRDIVPTFRSVAVYFDPLATDVDQLTGQMREVAAGSDESGPAPTARIEVPVCYEPEFGPDLMDVARFAALSSDAVIAAHTGQDYRVFMLGFVPGFAYLGIVDGRIAAPRRAVPRLKVPAGSVGIAGRQTGVYPQSTPGGWNIIGRTPLRMVSFDSPEPALLKAGDTVRFQAIDRGTFDKMAASDERGR